MWRFYETQIKALELLGKITEVALFTERREVIQVKDSGEIRARLMDSIRQAIKAQAVDAEVVDADSLLAEISGDQPGDSPISGDNVTTEGEGLSVGGSGTPPVGHPPELAVAQQLDLHSNPHNGSATIDKDSPTLDEASPTQSHISR